MKNVNNCSYLTKEEAAAAVKSFVAANPDTILCNFAHDKEARRQTTEAEREAMKVNGWVRLQVGVFGFQKLYTDDPILKAHPELRGYWKPKLYRGI